MILFLPMLDLHPKYATSQRVAKMQSSPQQAFHGDILHAAHEGGVSCE